MTVVSFTQKPAIPEPQQSSISDAPAKRALITLSLMAATLMQGLDTTITNVALPQMQGSLLATQDQVSWVLTSYIIATAIMTPLSGWMAGRFDLKHVFLASVVGFTAASALCGLAANLSEVVFFRLIQGLCGAALAPLSQAVLFDLTPRSNYSRAMSVWGCGVMLGPVAGPLLGGWLTQSYSWRWVFFINVPVGLFAAAGLAILLPPSGRKNFGKFDHFGFITFTVAIGALQLLLDRGELKDWFNSNEILIEVALAGLSLYLFMVHMLTSRQAYLNREMFRDRNFLIGNALVFQFGLVVFASLALIPAMLQNLLQYPILTTGLVLAPRGVGMAMTMLLAGRLIERMDPRIVMASGLLLISLSLWEMTDISLIMDSGPTLTAGLVQGLGYGLLMMPLSTMTFTTIPAHTRPDATAFYSLTRNVGSSIGISTMQFLLTRNTQIVHATLVKAVTIFGRGNIQSKSLYAMNREITRHAAMTAYIDDFYLMLILSLGALPLILVFRAAPPNAGALEQAIGIE